MNTLSLMHGSRRLRDAMKFSGLSPGQLARVSGVERGVIDAFLDCMLPIEDCPQVRKLAAAMDVSLVWLCDGRASPEAEVALAEVRAMPNWHRLSDADREHVELLLTMIGEKT